MNEELGEPLTYKALGRDAVPLALATFWPKTLTESDARHFAARLEFSCSEKIGALLCPHTHSQVRLFWGPCPECGAAL